jgi:hypothetical protein
MKFRSGYSTGRKGNAVKVPLFAMTLLGLALIAYGLLSLLRSNSSARSEVMKRLSPENQVKLTHILNTTVDLGGHYTAIDNIDKPAVNTGTCTAPTNGKENCPSP